MSSAANGANKFNALKLAFAVVRLIAVLSLVTFAYDWRTPLLTGVRPQALAVLLTMPALVIALEFWLMQRPSGRNIAIRALRIATLAVAGFVLIATASLEARFHWQRWQVLAAEPQQLESLGRHFIVGFRTWEDVRKLVELRAIAGIYVSAANVRDMTTADIRRHVDEIQAIRNQQNLPPLWITTDQEGGSVSRLSPPLVRMPPLADVVSKNSDPQSRRIAVQQYAETQGRELAAAGINLNFAPVVDINFSVKSSRDMSTRIYERAISDDADTVETWQRTIAPH